MVRSTSFAYAAKIYTDAKIPVTPCIGRVPRLKGCNVQGASFEEIKKFARSNPRADHQLAIVQGLERSKVVIIKDDCGEDKPVPDCLPDGTPPAPHWEAHGSWFWMYKYSPSLDAYKKTVLDLGGTCSLRIRRCVTVLPLDAANLLAQIKEVGLRPLLDAFLAAAIEEAQPQRRSYAGADYDDADYDCDFDSDSDLDDYEDCDE